MPSIVKFSDLLKEKEECEKDNSDKEEKEGTKGRFQYMLKLGAYHFKS